jgi:hypothetical protein
MSKPAQLVFAFAAAAIVGCTASPPPSPAEPEPMPAPEAPPESEAPPAPEPDPDPPAAPETETPPTSQTLPGPGAANWITRDMGVSIPDDWRSCKADTECVLVQTTCCDQCNGGKAVAVNKSRIQDAQKLRPQCQNTACTKRACMTRAACDNGACALQAFGGLP